MIFHKFHGTAVRYEVWESNLIGIIVRTNYPFPSGRFPDLIIFMNDIFRRLPVREVVIAENGYADVRFITSITVRDEVKDLHERLRVQDENLDGRLKSFSIIQHRFRHGVSLYSTVFHAVLLLTAIIMSISSPIFPVH